MAGKRSEKPFGKGLQYFAIGVLIVYFIAAFTLWTLSPFEKLGAASPLLRLVLSIVVMGGAVISWGISYGKIDTN